MPSSGLYAEMSKDSHNRKSERRRANIESDYRAQLDSVLASVDELERADDRAARTLRTTQVRQLTELMKRKVGIEAEIIKHAEELAGVYFRVRGEVGEAVLARVGGLQGVGAALRGAAAQVEGEGDDEAREGEGVDVEMEMVLDGAGDVMGVGGTGDGEGMLGEKGIKRKREEVMM